MKIKICAGLLLLWSGTALGQTTMEKHLFSATSGAISGGAYVIHGTLGDILTNPTSSGTTELWHGFYAPRPQQLVGVDGPRTTFTTYLDTPQPNPARLNLSVEFGNAVEQDVDIGVYDIAGRLVRQLYRGRMHAGVFRETWNLRSGNGQAVDPGVYFIRLTAGIYRSTTRCVVIQ